MDGTIIQQGSFTSTGANVTLQIRSDVDWMRVLNYTRYSDATINHAYDFYWQRGMAVNDAMYMWHGAASLVGYSNTAANAGVGGFTLVDSSVQAPGPAVAVTAVSNANPPVVSTGSTVGLATGSIVRMINIAGAQQIGGIDFTIGNVIANTSFTLANAGAGIVTVAGTTGFYRLQPNPSLYAPRDRVIASITNANPGVVTTTVNHGYQVGQEVRFNIPTYSATVFGMTQLNNVAAIITAVTASTFTINIDTTNFGTFTWPLTANYPFSPAMVTPFGDDTATALAQVPPLSSLEDSVFNTGYIGIILAGGALSPAGANNDFVYWRAGKSFNGS